MATFYSTNSKEYSIKKSPVEYVARKAWAIHALKNEITKEFNSYSLLYWSKNYLQAQIKNGIIIHEDQVYNVIYHNCCYGQLLPLDSGTQIALSFRVPLSKYGIAPCVLVNIPRGKEE